MPTTKNVFKFIDKNKNLKDEIICLAGNHAQYIIAACKNKEFKLKIVRFRLKKLQESEKLIVDINTILRGI